MQFTPKEIKYNVNVTHAHPLKEFFTLLGGLLLIVVISYFVLGAALDIIIARIPDKFEKTISRFYDSDEFGCIAGDEDHVTVQGILDKLLKLAPEDGRKYEVIIAEDEDSNAFALPGGKILILSGLLENAESENEVAMVLAHELGHFAHQDHLKGLSRGIVVVFLSAVVFGNNSSVTNFASNTLTRLDMRFSRAQERNADLFGLDLLNKTYGHVGGATDFFERMKDQDKYLKYVQFISTHPLSSDRVKELEQLISEKGYVRREKIPLQLSGSDGSEKHVED